MTEESYASQRLSLTQKLTKQQQALVERALDFCRKPQTPDAPQVFVIEGAPGTGKSLIMNHIFSALQRQARDKNAQSPLYGTHNYFLVNHAEMIKLYKELSVHNVWTRKKDYLRPTTFINSSDKAKKKADIVFIDEAHLLFTRPNRYNKFYQTNQLKEILRCAHRVILVFDAGQVLKFRSFWSPSRLKEILQGKQFEYVHLTEQFRMNAPPAIYRWIDAFCHQKKLANIPHSNYLRVYDDAQAMYLNIRQLNARYGLSRMLSTYDYFYRLDGHKYYIQEGRFRLPWDISCPMARLPWAERPETVGEVGSVYTIQGFDLNYAGIIIGPSIVLDRNDPTRLKVKPEYYEDYAAFYGAADVNDSVKDKERIMMNALYVLMTRPVKGLFLYAHDEALRDRLYKLWRNTREA